MKRDESKNIKIVSGGQTGMDRGALEAAIAMSAANAKDEALKWLRQFLGLSSALVLNVAGPRESKAPGRQGRRRSWKSCCGRREGDMV